MPLADLDHLWGSDLSSGNTGDLATVTGTERGKQRVLRRLMTNPGEYIWEPTYGAGLPQYIGEPGVIGEITAVIRSALALEDAVAKSPPPQVTVAELDSDPSGFSVSIAYTDAPSNQPVVLSFNVTP
jgi:phage baseplate assembly protein W